MEERLHGGEEERQEVAEEHAAENEPEGKVEEEPFEGSVLAAEGFEDADEGGFVENQDEQPGDHVESGDYDDEGENDRHVHVQEAEPVEYLGGGVVECGDAEETVAVVQRQEVVELRSGIGEGFEVTEFHGDAGHFAGRPAVEALELADVAEDEEVVIFAEAGVVDSLHCKEACPGRVLNEVGGEFVAGAESEEVCNGSGDEDFRRGAFAVQAREGAALEVASVEGGVVEGVHPFEDHSVYFGGAFEDGGFGDVGGYLFHPTDTPQDAEEGVGGDDAAAGVGVVVVIGGHVQVGREACQFFGDFLLEAPDDEYGEEHNADSQGNACHGNLDDGHRYSAFPFAPQKAVCDE